MPITEDQEQAQLDITTMLAEAARELRARQRLQGMLDQAVLAEEGEIRQALQRAMSSPPACPVCKFLDQPGPCPGNFPNCPKE